MATKKRLHFKSDSEEARWWEKNQDFVADLFDQAKAAGRLGRGTVARMAKERVSAEPTGRSR